MLGFISSISLFRCINGFGFPANQSKQSDQPPSLSCEISGLSLVTCGLVSKPCDGKRQRRQTFAQKASFLHLGIYIYNCSAHLSTYTFRSLYYFYTYIYMRVFGQHVHLNQIINLYTYIYIYIYKYNIYIYIYIFAYVILYLCVV